jgi:predicted amidohydrolase
VPANWPTARRRHWTALLEARAIENQAFVVGVNRVGEGGRSTKLHYSGDSRIVDPLGEVRAAAAGGEALLVTDIDAAEVARAREQFPFIQDRRQATPRS